MPRKPFTGQPWSVEKLEFLESYLPAFAKACKKVLDKGYDIHYVDGFAGSGINVIDGTERAGSALLALAENFTKYHFVEHDSSNFAALSQGTRPLFAVGDIGTRRR